MKILVTGGSGFIGTNLIEHYKNKGFSVVNFDVIKPRCRAHKKHWCKVNVLDGGTLRDMIVDYGPDLVFHSAARTDLNGKSLTDYEVNTTGVSNLVDAVRKIRNCKVIFLSSMLVCKLGYNPRHDIDYCPVNSYGKSKVEGEKIVRQVDVDELPWTIVRPTSIWGPWFGIPYINFFQAVQRGLYFHPSNKKIFRSYGFVGNTIFQLDKIASASQSDSLGKTFYLADYPALEIKHWADMIQKEMGVRRVFSSPVIILQLVALFGDLLKLVGVHNPPLSTSRLRNLLTEMVFDLETLQKVVGGLPYSTEEGVRQTVQWMNRAS